MVITLNLSLEVEQALERKAAEEAKSIDTVILEILMHELGIEFISEAERNRFSESYRQLNGH